MKIDFEYTCGSNRFFMDLFGFWPKPRTTFIGKNWALINALIVLTVIIIPRFAAITLFWNEIDAVVQTLSNQLLFLLVLSKLITLHFGNKDFTILWIMAVLVESLGIVEKDLSTELSEQQYLRALKNVTIGKKIALLLGVGFICTVAVGSIATKLYHMDSFYIQNPDPRLSVNFLFVVYLPFNTTTTAAYMTILSCQFYTAIMSTGIHFTFDSFIVMLVLYICGQLEIMQESLAQLVKDILGFEEKDFQIALREILMKHQAVYRFTKKMDELFNFTWFLQLLTCSLTLCFQGYTVKKLLHSRQPNMFQLGFILCHAFGLLAQFFFICWAAENLTSESTAVGYAYYRSEWYTLIPSNARSLLMIGHQARRPLSLSTWKFSVLSLSLFLKVLKASFSYLSMLLVITDS